MRGFHNICISDKNKALMLRNPTFVQILVDGLFLEQGHMRSDTGPEVLSEVQGCIADCIQQIALFPAGCAALQEDRALLVWHPV